jgi:hypothetical protein
MQGRKVTVLSRINTIILHTPKTGGSSVRWPAIQKHGLKYSCQHCNYKMLPEEYKNFHKMTFVRNPLDWYRSRYNYDKFRFKVIKKYRDAMTTALSHYYKKNLNETLEAFLNPDEAFRDKKTRDIYRRLIKLDVVSNYTCWNVSYHDNIDSVDYGYFQGKTYYQWLLHMIGVHEADSVYRLEDEYEIGMKKEFGDDVELIYKNKTPKIYNIETFTKSNKQLILSAEADMIEKYRYKL